MSEYRFFAKVYDRMMDDIPYEEWEQYILLLLCKFGVSPFSKMVELGCGTGTLTELLAEDGFEITGIDLSEKMLEIAKEKLNQKLNQKQDFDVKISYLCHDMRDFVLDERQDVAISICDSMNYLLTVDDLAKAMTAARNALTPEGIFIFDLKTEYFFKTKLDGITFADDMGDFSYVWKNYYDEEKRIHEYRLRFKLKDGEGLRIEDECHRQRTFSASEIKEAAEKAGFRKAVAYDAFTFDRPKINSDRIYLVCLQ